MGTRRTSLNRSHSNCAVESLEQRQLLSGEVQLSDFNRLASNYGASGKVWATGDYNYDGTVNLADFNLLAGNFGISAGADGVIDPWEWAGMDDETWSQAKIEKTGKPEVYVADGTLKLLGTPKGDKFIVDQDLLDSMHEKYPSQTISRIKAVGNVGRDRIEIRVKLPATILGGAGNDKLVGGELADSINAGTGNDVVRGMNGNDTIYGSGGHDNLPGDAGADNLRGGAGNDTLLGNAGNDMLIGNAGRDRLVGGAGINKLDARDTIGAHDVLVASRSFDRIISRDRDDQVLPA
jgi:Ca2+-binding RTX toxin-like protein